jgi:hypothetical protein
VLGTLNRLFRHTLRKCDSGVLPESVRGTPHRDASVEEVILSRSYLLRVWRWRVLEALLVDTEVSYPVASRWIAKEDPRAVAVLNEMLSDGQCGAYLITRTGAVEPVRVAAASQPGLFALSPALAEALCVAEQDVVSLYLPGDAAAQQEAMALALDARRVTRYGLDEETALTILQRWGHVVVTCLDAGLDGAEALRWDVSKVARVDTSYREVSGSVIERSPMRLRFSSEVSARDLGLTPDSGRLPAQGTNVATWMVRQLTRWPTELQRALRARIKEGRLRSKADVEAFVRAADRPFDTRPVEVCYGLWERIYGERGEVAFWQLQTPGVLWRVVASEDIELRARDFLSRIVLGDSMQTGTAYHFQPPVVEARGQAVQEVHRAESKATPALVDETPGNVVVNARNLARPAPTGTGWIVDTVITTEPIGLSMKALESLMFEEGYCDR